GIRSRDRRHERSSWVGHRLVGLAKALLSILRIIAHPGFVFVVHGAGSARSAGLQARRSRSQPQQHWAISPGVGSLSPCVAAGSAELASTREHGPIAPDARPRPDETGRADVGSARL